MNWGNIRANWGKNPVVKHLTCACYPQPHPRHPTTSLSPLTEGKLRSSCVNDVLRPAVPAYEKRARHICQTRRYFTQGVVSKHTQRGVKNTARCRVTPRITAERPQKHGTSLIKPRQPLSYPSYTAITRSQGLHAVVDRGCRVPGKNSKSVKPETTGIRPRS